MIKKHKDMDVEVRANMRGGEGEITIQHCLKKDEFTAQSRLCAKLTIPSGASIGTHQHDGEDEVYVILKGTGVLDDGSAKTEVSEGDAILTGNGESHAIANNGTEPLELMAVIMCY